MRVWIIPALAAVSLVGGCSNKQEKAPAPPASPKIPSAPLSDAAVFAGFESGQGKWRVEVQDKTPPPAYSIAKGSAARGQGYLHFSNVECPEGESRTIDVYLPVTERNWLTSGDTARASIRLRSLGGAAMASLFVRGSDGADHLSEPTPVTETWSQIVYPAGDVLKDVSRIGVRFVVKGRFKGSLSLDDVRIGPAAPKEPVYTVVAGPFRSRSDADAFIEAQAPKGIQGSPVFEEAWYAKLADSGTKAGAAGKASKLQAQKIKTSIIAR